MNKLNRNIHVTPEADELFVDEFDVGIHCLTVMTKRQNLNGGNNGCLAFSSYFALYQFGLSLVNEAVYDVWCLKEFQSYDDLMIIDGIWVGPQSERLFIGCDNFGEYKNLPNQFTLTDNFSNMFPDNILQSLQAGISTLIETGTIGGFHIYFSTELIMYQFGIFLLWHAAYEKNFKSDWLEIYKTRIYFFNPEFHG